MDIKSIISKLDRIEESPAVGDVVYLEFGNTLEVETTIVEVNGEDIVLEADDKLLGLLEDLYEIEERKVYEAEYQGRNVKLGKPFLTPDGPKKRSVYVKNSKGNVVKVNFGDKKMRIKKSNPKRKKSFRARHNCANAKDRTSARYWSCKFW